MKRTWFERLAPSAIGVTFGLGLAVLIGIVLVQALSHARAVLP